MKIGFNVKNIINAFKETIYFLSSKVIQNETRISALENSSGGGGSEWVEITSSNGQDAEITQRFTEIKMQARGTGTLYSVTCNYDNIIFHNSSSDAPTYIVTGNPIENNYGCKFKYMKQPITEKQYVCVDSCFSGGSQEGIEFRAWIKPDNTPY